MVTDRSDRLRNRGIHTRNFIEVKYKVDIKKGS